jgi:hypothetical protein
MVPLYLHLQGKEGFTGEKGIGIKSVFSVCDTYEIHSNGFHIGFDKRLSIMEPYNITEDAKCIQNIFYPDHRGSVLRLPFTRSIFRSISAELRKICLEDLLLFTRKICYFKTEGSQRLVRETMPVDAKRSWIKFSHSNPDAQSYWYLKTATCTPSQKRTERHKRFVDTKVSIAVRFEKKDSGSSEASDGDCDGASNDGDDECDDESKGAANSDTDCDDNDCWVTSGVTERPLLCFPEDPKLHPIYAFLPTQECIFPFALQGDFILTANREALTDCLWNRQLLNEVPQLFIEVMLDLAGAVNNRFHEDRATAMCLLSEHPSTAGAAAGAGAAAVLGVSSNSPRFDIELLWADVLSLLPKPSSKDLFKPIVDGIYEALCEMPFLLSSTGARWCSSKLIMGSVLFNPAELIPEGLLERCTGKRFLHRMVAPIDREIVKLLRITALDVNTVYHCIEAASKEQSPPLSLSQSPLPSTSIFFPFPSVSHSEDNSSTHPDLIPIHILAGLLLALVKLSPKCQEAKVICDKLRCLYIWPTAASCVRISLEGKVVYIPGKTKSRCLSLLPPDLVTLIDMELFIQADKLSLGGAADLQKWLLLNFKPRSNRRDRESCPFRGLELLSLHAVALNDIIPLFEKVKRNGKGNEKEKEKWIEKATWDEKEKEKEKEGFELNRVTAAACMAVLFLSNTPLGDSAIIPTLQASGNTADEALLWSNAVQDRESHLRTSIKSTKNQGRRLIERESGIHEEEEEEVHLGLESESSAVCCMERQGLKSTLQQVTPQAPTSVYHHVVHKVLLSTSLTFPTLLFLMSHSLTYTHSISALYLI